MLTMNKYKIPRDHKDLEILCKATNTKPDDIGLSFRRGIDESYECNYMRTYNLRYWEQESTMQLADAIKKANQKTTEYQFELVDVTNFESDDDRQWPATFQFKSIKK